MSRTARIVNFLLFQICWMACVWGAARGMGWLGPVCVAVFAAIELPRMAHPAREVLLLLTVAVLGTLVDTSYLAMGLVEYASSTTSGVAPLWITGLWVSFALTLNRSLDWLAARPLLAASLGLLGGPLAYWIAFAVWGAGRFVGDTWLALLIIGVAWALITPLLFVLAARLVPQPQLEPVLQETAVS